MRWGTGRSVTRALFSAAAGLLTGMAMGLKLPEMPFCIGFAAALIALGGNWRHQLVRLLAGGAAGVVGFVIFSGPWMLYIYHLTGNPLFPYFNEYWKSPLALARALSRPAFCAFLPALVAAAVLSRSCSASTGMSPTIWAFRTSASALPICW